MVTATTSFTMAKEVEKDETFLLDSGKRFRQLDFSKDPWPEVQSRLRQLDWSSLESLAKVNVIDAHALFIDTLLPFIEELVPRNPV